MGKQQTNIALVGPSSLQPTALCQGVAGTVINTVGGYMLGILQGVCCSARINKRRQISERESVSSALDNFCVATDAPKIVPLF